MQCSVTINLSKQSAVQCSVMEYSTVMCSWLSTVEYSTVQCSIVQCNALKPSVPLT